MPLSTGGGILSTKAVRLVRLVRSGGPGFVPFLFPGSMPASKATDVGRTTDASGNPLRAGLTDTTSGGSALTCDVLVWGWLSGRSGHNITGASEYWRPTMLANSQAD